MAVYGSSSATIRAERRNRRFSQTSSDREKEKKDDDRDNDDGPEASKRIGEEQEKQDRTPWHRQGADEPPVRKLRSAGAMTKGITTQAAISDMGFIR